MSKFVIKNNRYLQSPQVLNALITIVDPFLPLELQNTYITAEDIIAVLVYASSNRISTDAVCYELKGAPSANHLREILAKHCQTVRACNKRSTEFCALKRRVL